MCGDLGAGVVCGSVGAGVVGGTDGPGRAYPFLSFWQRHCRIYKVIYDMN